MAKGFKHGASGTSLNFKVKTYPSETELKADKPSVNTLAICSTTTMTSWVFDATEPESPAVGMVWFPVGTSGTFEINALKNNVLNIYPQSAKQYVGEKWVDVPSFIYDGEWKSLVTKLYLYKAGDECTDITGGYTSIKLGAASGINGYAPAVTKNATDMYMVQNHSYNCGIVHVTNKIDITRHRELVFDGKVYSSKGAEQCRVAVWSDIGTYAQDNIVAELQADGVDGVRTLDISKLSGSHVIGFYLHTTDGADSSVTMKNLYLQ